ncbi:thiamine pyrophosphate-dependent enzyme [Inmirania thermothiophila]|uniref:Indolepyruvate oxidoreductase subunit IorA n=1 Tax=Inmirania thermothiophila TaxID=1750597 RepID=A0A3N1Y9P8_9GAMM|nr:thiamine pyrophosphate-dependent enzyme [Inmirania thermothiophila]ROR34342.1 indolepyruvate ferredoxin oxidoreductase alpha subunit [Inmirania thermothiophila]
MHAAVHAAPATRLLLSGNEAVARAAWEAGVRVAAAYPGTPSTEILECLAAYPDLHAQWSTNEKVALEVAIGASLAGSRALAAMKHVGVNVASDALMTQTLLGARGGLVLAVADDVGMSSSQNEQDSRFWGRFAHLPVLEPADAEEAYAYTREAFALSERFETPVILRLTTRVCHVKGLVTVGAREAVPARGFERDPARYVMVPAHARRRLPIMLEREARLAEHAEASPLNRLEDGADRRVGFVVSGPAYLAVREAFPEAPVLKLGLSHPLPVGLARRLAEKAERVVVVEETEPLVEQELRAAGLEVTGKAVLPRMGELSADVVGRAVRAWLGEPVEEHARPAPVIFPRPPTMCPACPHLGVFFTLSRLRNVIISGDIGCYTLGAGHPWNALDTTICMGASLSVALGLDKGRGEQDRGRHVVAVIGDSTFLHMGMQGLLDIVYNRGDVTVLILDNRAVGMTGGQDHPGTGRDARGEEAPRVDFAALVRALGVPAERVHEVDPYELPTLFRTLRAEIKRGGPSVIITNRPCVLIDAYRPTPPLRVDEARCTGCGNCLDVGCPAILVTRRERAVKPSGKEVELAFVRIESLACTGCNLCVGTCAPDAIVPMEGRA